MRRFIRGSLRSVSSEILLLGLKPKIQVKFSFMVIHFRPTYWKRVYIQLVYQNTPMNKTKCAVSSLVHYGELVQKSLFLVQNEKWPKKVQQSSQMMNHRTGIGTSKSADVQMVNFKNKVKGILSYEYRSGTVNSNTVNSKFHLIWSYCEIFFYHFPNISCLKCTVNLNFHLIWSKILLMNDFELTDPNLYMSHFSYSCKTERQNGISRLISKLLHTLNSSLRNCLFHVTEWKFPNSLIMQTC